MQRGAKSQGPAGDLRWVTALMCLTLALILVATGLAEYWDTGQFGASPTPQTPNANANLMIVSPLLLIIAAVVAQLVPARHAPVFIMTISSVTALTTAMNNVAAHDSTFGGAVVYAIPCVAVAMSWNLRVAAPYGAAVSALALAQLVYLNGWQVGVSRWVLLTVVTSSAAVAISLAREAEMQALERLRLVVDHDDLTLLVSRQRFDTDLSHAAAAVSPPGLGLLVVDADYLKQVNDQGGHSVGDAYLVQVSELMTAVAPKSATVARLGGDEFAMILPGVTAEQAENFAATLIETCCATSFRVVEGVHQPVSVSVGVAHSSAAVRPEHLVAQADTALYQAKRAGRARYHVWSAAIDDREPGPVRADQAMVPQPRRSAAGHVRVGDS